MGSKKKINVAVLMGGISGEREVSLNSGREVLKGLAKLRNIEAIPIEIDKTGQWQLGKKIAKFKEGSQLSLPTSQMSKSLTVYSQNNLDLVENILSINLFLIILHGKYGEDGTVQGLLDLIGIPYIGSGVLASALAMDKQKAKIIYDVAGLKITNTQHILTRFDPIPTQVDLPVVVKPNAGGSSLGVTICRQKNQINDAINIAFLQDDTVLIEDYIEGIELTCPVLGSGDQTSALPVIEIIPNKGDFYDYSSKYDDAGSTHIIPARISPSQTNLVMEEAIAAHRALGCLDMSRSDFILTANNELYILETNTIPGMTPNSLLPQSAHKSGIEFSSLLKQLINGALARKR